MNGFLNLMELSQMKRLATQLASIQSHMKHGEEA